MCGSRESPREAVVLMLVSMTPRVVQYQADLILPARGPGTFCAIVNLRVPLVSGWLNRDSAWRAIKSLPNVDIDRLWPWLFALDEGLQDSPSGGPVARQLIYYLEPCDNVAHGCRSWRIDAQEVRA